MKIAFSFEFSLFNKEKKVYYPAGTKCEISFPIALWKELKDGDYVIYRRSGKIRKIISAKNGNIKFENTCYCSGDRYMFAPVIAI